MIDCVKCGKENADDAPFCEDCTWPFTLEGWKTTKYRVSRLTIDTSCINFKQADNDLNTIERWATEGRLAIQRSDALLSELRGSERIAKAHSIDEHSPVWEMGVSRIGIDTNPAGPDMAEPIRNIMFPTTSILSSNQEHDIQHLRSHVLTGGDVFVTRNPKDFIVNGKQSKLSKLGIWAFAPSELVAFLRGLYGWK